MTAVPVAMAETRAAEDMAAVMEAADLEGMEAVAEAVMDDGAPCFVAFSTIDGQPWEAGASVAALLDRVRSLSVLSIGLTRCTEILDFEAEADEVSSQSVPLDEPRRRSATVFRGEECGVDLERVDLSTP